MHVFIRSWARRFDSQAYSLPDCMWCAVPTASHKQRETCTHCVCHVPVVIPNGVCSKKDKVERKKRLVIIDTGMLPCVTVSHTRTLVCAHENVFMCAYMNLRMCMCIRAQITELRNTMLLLISEYVKTF